MCDMQNLPTEDASCEENSSDMNFATFQTVNSGTHFVTSSQLPKLQHNAANGTLQHVVLQAENGVQYVRTLDGSLQPASQLLSVPIALPGSKPGDPQQTVQIQVLNPNMLQQQQPKYQMQIPIQGFQPGAVITLAYSPETNDSGNIQLIGNSLPEGLQVLTAMPPQEMHIVQQQPQEEKPVPIQHQVFITPDNQIVIKGPEDSKSFNNNTSTNNNNMETDVTDIVIKEECEDNDDESFQNTESSDTVWAHSGNQDLIKYLNTLPPQQAQALPASLQQFLKLNPLDNRSIEIEIAPATETKSEDVVAEAVLGEDGSVRIQTKKKRKYKKKPLKPARPRPGQVVITLDAQGALYCCPECQLAFRDKEQLEHHLAVHKIERRFICGICGAGLKRKEHLERHKLGHNPERPYVCGVCRKGFKRREHLNLHAVIHSGVKSETCNICGKGFYRKDHLRKHTRSHETKRARDEAANGTDDKRQIPEITIHVPTSANNQMPVQINIPQHVVTSLTQQQTLYTDAQSQLDALLQQHSTQQQQHT